MRRLLFIFAFCTVLLAAAEPEGSGVARVRAKANEGLAGAQYNLAEFYANGYGVPKDAAQAAAWYRKSADQGYGEAEFALGLAGLEGRGLPKDEVEGLAWITVAAQSGNVTLVKFRSQLEQRFGPRVVQAAQERSKVLQAAIGARKRAKAAADK